VRDAVAALLNHKAVPVPIERPIELFFDLPRDVAEVRDVVVLKGAQGSDDRVLYFVY